MKQSDLVALGDILRRLGRRELPPTSDEIRLLRLDLEEYERELTTTERHLSQAKDMNPDQPVNWPGHISTFAEDMVFHAKRLGRDVHGVFNERKLIASPTSTVVDVLRQFDEAKIG